MWRYVASIRSKDYFLVGRTIIAAVCSYLIFTMTSFNLTIVIFITYLTTITLASNHNNHWCILINLTELLFLVKPKLVPFSKNLDLFQNSTYVLSCNLISGTRPLFFEWHKNGRKLEASEHIYINNSASYSLLTFSQLQSIHSGQYSCTAKNAHGTDLTITQLVKGPFSFT